MCLRFCFRELPNLSWRMMPCGTFLVRRVNTGSLLAYRTAASLDPRSALGDMLGSGAVGKTVLMACRYHSIEIEEGV